jgi:hypothetical protein
VSNILQFFKKLIKDKRGMSNLLVFMLLLPFLVGFVIAMAQLTIIGVSQSVVNNAAFEGARAGARAARPTSAAVQSANKYGSSIFNNWNTKSSVKAKTSGNTLTVTVKYTFPTYAYFNMESIRMTKTVQASSSQLIENRP